MKLKIIDYFRMHLAELIGNSSRLFLSELFSQIVAFLQVIMIVRFLGAANYGLFALVIVYVTVVNQLIDFRIKEAVVKYLSEFLIRKDQGRLWASLKLCYLLDFITGVIAFLIAFFTAQLVATFIMHNAQAACLIQLFAFMLLISTLDNSCSGVLIVFEKFTALSIYAIASASLRFILVGVILLLGFGIKGVLAGYIIAALISSTAIVFISLSTIKKSVWFPGIAGSISLLKDRWREIAAFLININFNESITLVVKNIDVLILGYFRAPTEVGLYRLAKNFTEILSLLSNSVYTAIYPQFSRLWADRRKEEFKALIKRITIFMGGITLPLTVGLFLAIPWIIRVFVGEGFSPVASLVKIMVWGIAAAVVSLWVRPVFLSMGRPGVLTIINMCNALMLLVLSLIFVPRFGYFASAVIYTYPYIAGHLLAALVAWRILKRP